MSLRLAGCHRDCTAERPSRVEHKLLENHRSKRIAGGMSAQPEAALPGWPSKCQLAGRISRGAGDSGMARRFESRSSEYDSDFVLALRPASTGMTR